MRGGQTGAKNARADTNIGRGGAIGAQTILPRFVDLSRSSPTCLSRSPALTTMVAIVQKPAPTFKAEAVVDGLFQDISLADYLGQWCVIALFSHRLQLFTAGCPSEGLSSFSTPCKCPSNCLLYPQVLIIRLCVPGTSPSSAPRRFSPSTTRSPHSRQSTPLSLVRSAWLPLPVPHRSRRVCYPA